MMDGQKDARTDGRTWATLNALPHSTNSGGIKITPVVSNAKTISMGFFVLWSFIFLMHHSPIKTIGYVTDVIEISC